MRYGRSCPSILREHGTTPLWYINLGLSRVDIHRRDTEIVRVLYRPEVGYA